MLFECHELGLHAAAAWFPWEENIGNMDLLSVVLALLFGAEVSFHQQNCELWSELYPGIGHGTLRVTLLRCVVLSFRDST